MLLTWWGVGSRSGGLSTVVALADSASVPRWRQASRPGRVQQKGWFLRVRKRGAKTRELVVSNRALMRAESPITAFAEASGRLVTL